MREGRNLSGYGFKRAGARRERKGCSMNAYVEMIKNRCSIRSFTDEPLTQEELQNLIDAGLAAPSGANLQNWHFTFVTNKAIVNEIETYLVDRVMAGDNERIKQLIESRGRKIFFNAAVVVFLSTKDGGSLVDAGAAIENIVLAAEAMGLKSCVLGGCRDAFTQERADYFKKLVKMPEGYEFAVAAAIGHPAMSSAPHERLMEKVTVL